MIDIRWKQRFSNLQKSLSYLADAIEIENPSILEQIPCKIFMMINISELV